MRTCALPVCWPPSWWPCVPRMIGVLLLCILQLLPTTTIAAAGDKPLTQLIQEAEAQKGDLARKKQALKVEWTRNQQLLVDLARFRDTAQRNVEKGVVVLSSRLFKDAVAPLVKNHGVGVIKTLTGVSLSSTQSASGYTVGWAALRDRAVAMISQTQKRQAQLLSQMQQIDLQSGHLNEQIGAWKTAYKRSTGYDYSGARPPGTSPGHGGASLEKYDYQGALGAWAADYAAEVNKRTYDDGASRTTCQFEWVTQPVVRDGQIVGASRIWHTTTYYSGAQAGKTVRSLANESYDAQHPGPYISVGELQRKYPRFIRRQ